MKDLLKTAGGVGIAILAGTLLSQVEPFRNGQFLWWPASSVLKFAAFSGSALLVGMQGERISKGLLIADNEGLTGIVKALLVGALTALGYGAVNQVVAPELVASTHTAFATLMVGATGYTVWKAYDGFDDVIALAKGGLVKRITDGYTPVPSEPRLVTDEGPVFKNTPIPLNPVDPNGPEPQCSQCGNFVPTKYTFCGVCGTRVMPSDQLAARRG